MKNTQSFVLRNFFSANKSRFYWLYVKKKTCCGLLSIYISSRLTYLMKDEISSQVVFPQWLKKYSLTLCCIEVLLDSICNIDIDIDLRLKISNIT